ASRADTATAQQQIQEAVVRVRDQGKKLQELRLQVNARGRSSDLSSRVSQGSSRGQQAQVEAQGLRDSNEHLRADIEAVKLSLDKVAEEANSKIDAANERIRSLRRERDDALKEADRLRGEG
ncbi:unnamed protein product, partial [Effrenium voratum]